MKISRFFLPLLALSLCSCASAPASSPASNPGSSPSSTASIAHFTISFFDEASVKLADVDYAAGDIPSYSYEKKDTPEWNYTTKGWAATAGGDVLSSLPAVSQNASYYAIIGQTKQRYTITFVSNGGSPVASQTAEYGTSIAEPEEPTYESHAFVCWCSDEALKTEVTWPITLTANVSVYAKWNEVVNIKTLLSAMLNGIATSPLSFIPETMRAGASANLATESEITYDYSSFIKISAIRHNGFGEQWNMVIDNICQSQRFFNVLTLADSGITAGVAAFNAWFDNNPSDTANYSTKVGDYSVKVVYADGILDYVLQFDVGNPFSDGTVTAQIAMNYDVAAKDKTVRIQVGDPNAIKYEIKDNSYKFAIKYLGIRRAQCELTKADDGTIDGKIYEYIVASQTLKYASCALFSITDDYVTAVGNKASGIVGFSNYIVELYKADTGKLLGYEVMETKTVSSVSVTFNTLWLNLDEISGFTNIKYLTGQEDTTLNGMYVNDRASIFVTKNVGGISLKTASRRFDLEMRSRVFYTYDSETKVYTSHLVQIPMLFVQEEQFDTLVKDVKSTNNIDISVLTSQTMLTEIKTQYQTMVPEFIEAKEAVTDETIIAYIGTAYVF